MADREYSLRDAFGCFATGICLVTTPDPSGGFAGVTINSFSSVSLAPPLLSWCLDLKSRRYGVMSNMQGFVVNILSDQQQDVAQQAASSSDFNAADWPGQATAHGWVFDDALASFQCKMWKTVEAGDHTMFMGEVVQHGLMSEGRPLMYYRGKFAELA